MTRTVTRLLLPLLALGLGACGMLRPNGPLFPARAEQPPPRAIQPLRIDTPDGRRCTAVRLDYRTVATAAHCVAGAARVTLSEGAHVLVSDDILLHPAHGMGPADRLAGADLAKLHLPTPYPSGRRLPLAPLKPGPVDVLRLGPDGRTKAVVCGYVGQTARMAELSCATDLGWSGAPVVQQGALVGLLSGRGRVGATDIAQMAKATGLDSF